MSLYPIGSEEPRTWRHEIGSVISAFTFWIARTELRIEDESQWDVIRQPLVEQAAQMGLQSLSRYAPLSDEDRSAALEVLRSEIGLPQRMLANPCVQMTLTCLRSGGIGPSGRLYKDVMNILCELIPRYEAQHGWPLADALCDLLPWDIFRLTYWQECLMRTLPYIDQLEQRERILRHCENVPTHIDDPTDLRSYVRCEQGISLTGFLLRSVVSELPLDSPVRKSWIERCIVLALDYGHHSLVHGLVGILKQGIWEYPALVDLMKSWLYCTTTRGVWSKIVGLGPLRYFEREDLRSYGFERRAKRITKLKRTDELARIPDERGVYVVFHDRGVSHGNIRKESIGGRFKGRTPTVPVEMLVDRWSPNGVLYIGKAGKSLRKRIGEYMRCGRGESHRHWGGRYIWQLDNCDDLFVTWKVLTDENPRDVERQLLRDYEAFYGKLPFANIRRYRR